VTVFTPTPDVKRKITETLENIDVAHESQPSKRRKYNNIPINEKLEIVKYIENGNSYYDVSVNYSHLPIHKSTVWN